MAPQAVWYWFFSGKSEADFAADAQDERNAAVRALFRSEQAELDIRNDVARLGVSEYHRHQIYRQHRTNYRTYPLGWLCVRSYDQKYIAFVDGYTLQVFSVDAESKTVDRLVLTRRDAHRARTYVEFSRDSRLLAYTTEENAVRLNELETGHSRWIAKPATQAMEPFSQWAPATVCLEFSHDQKYLVQQSQLRPPTPVERPNVWARERGPQAIHVWKVGTGDAAFTPYPHWRPGLRFVSFHPSDSSLLPLQRSTSGPNADGIWNVPTGELIRTLPQDGKWDQ